MPYLNDLLSQYECLLIICSNLTTADLVHLSNTCKDNRMHITASDPIRARLHMSTRCSGKGIIAQARLFGHHGGPDLSELEWECLEGDEEWTRLCTECGVSVCDVCAVAAG